MSERKPMPAEMYRHYDLGLEQERLTGRGGLEFRRTASILERHLPDPPSAICDVGGGAGIYALPLAARGYEVHLIDAVSLHVEQAREAAAASGLRLASCEVGDARALSLADDSVDAVLVFGPLYHLTERNDRIQALREACRVVRSGGAVFTAHINRFASMLDGMARSFLTEEEFSGIVDRDLVDGQHRNPSEHPAYFTTAYFHHPEAIGSEFIDAGLGHEATLSVEGPAWLMPHLLDSEEPAEIERVMTLLERTESEPALLGVSAHLLGVGRKP